jgi:hypothetical protein
MSEHSNIDGAAPPSRFIAFFDECGDHSLTKIDPDFPLFVLAMVVIERDAYRDEVLPKLNAFKLRYWNHEGINLHSRDIRLAQGPFSILLNAQVRQRFMDEISGLMDTLPFTLFVTAIRKTDHVERHGAEATNPYDLAVEFTMERVLHFLETQGETLLGTGVSQGAVARHRPDSMRAIPPARLSARLSVEEKQHRGSAACRPVRLPLRPAHSESRQTKPRIRDREAALLFSRRCARMDRFPQRLKIKWALPAFARERPPTEHSQSCAHNIKTLANCKFTFVVKRWT